MARRNRGARPDEPPGKRDSDVRSLRAWRPFAPGPDQGLLLGRARGPLRGPLSGREWLFRKGRVLSRTVLRTAGAGTARPVGRRAARSTATICDDPVTAHRLQQPPRRAGDPLARPAGPFDRASAVREGPRRIAR